MALDETQNPTTSAASHTLETSASLVINSNAKIAPIGKPLIVGIYGIPGSGKTFLLNQLKQELNDQHFRFYEGSEVICALVPGGLAAFQVLAEPEKAHWRQLSINKIRSECVASGQVGVVSGHFMFWSETDELGCRVYTSDDLNTYTHIIYLNISAEQVLERRISDTEKDRPAFSVEHLQKWLEVEKAELRQLCRDHGILFSLVTSAFPGALKKTSVLLTDFSRHNEEYNQQLAEARLDEALVKLRYQGPLETMLVLDADKTLAAEDTGALFWQAITAGQPPSQANHCPLKALFSSSLGYTYNAFRQATLLYEEVADDEAFDGMCKAVASAVTVHPEFVQLLRLIARQDHVGAVILTCGLRCVWEKVLEREGLSETVKVIGGGRLTDGFVVTAELKAALVTRLRDVHHQFVWAFGDSVLDLLMLQQADQALVVVGEEHLRSKSMEDALLDAIDNHGLLAQQVVLPAHATPRLSTAKLPRVSLAQQDFVDAVLLHRRRPVLHATDRVAAKLLMAPMRDARLAGPRLREAHHRVGWYLASEFVADAIGLEEYAIPHVQGHQTSGHRLSREQHTCIVALMRGGEPMALGVNDAFPLAMFIHARVPEDVKLHHIQTQGSVLLVDSVVNSGKSATEFIQHIRRMDATIRIVVVAGVVQSQATATGDLAEALGRDANLSIVALRLSDNKYTGSGTTDTGNRLFNTTHLL